MEAKTELEKRKEEEIVFKYCKHCKRTTKHQNYKCMVCELED